MIAQIKSKEKKVQIGCGLGCLGFLVVGGILQLANPSRPGTTTPEPSNSPTITTPAESPHSASTRKHIVGTSWFGCRDRDDLSKLISYAAQGDREAFSRGLAEGVADGQCTVFKDGEEVVLTDTAIFSGLVKVRRVGDTEEWWTNIEAVK
ncbi:MAG: hypothetical protein JST05_01280 [Acidobacteria bacterium]|nr:hypothetical protein [Acidobacteriota bacterium]